MNDHLKLKDIVLVIALLAVTASSIVVSLVLVSDYKWNNCGSSTSCTCVECWHAHSRLNAQISNLASRVDALERQKTGSKSILGDNR